MPELIDDGRRALYVFNKQESGWRRNIAPLAVTYISRLDFAKMPLGVKMIIVFGSAARPSFRQESDIDFCFLVADGDMVVVSGNGMMGWHRCLNCTALSVDIRLLLRRTDKAET